MSRVFIKNQYKNKFISLNAAVYLLSIHYNMDSADAIGYLIE